MKIPSREFCILNVILAMQATHFVSYLFTLCFNCNGLVPFRFIDLNRSFRICFDKFPSGENLGDQGVLAQGLE